MEYWKDKVVVITGASSGFGRELAAAFVHENANVALVARDASRLDEVSSSLGERAVAFMADVTLNEDVERLHNEVLKRFGHCLLYTSPSPRDATLSRMPSSA